METLILSCPTLEGELNNSLKKYNSSAQVRYLPSRLHSDMKEILPYLQNILDNLSGVDRVVLLLTGCGGSTKGLVFRQGELVIPKTHDCLDILLSQNENCQVKNRDPNGIYMTGSWYEYHMKTLLNADAQVKKLGYDRASELLRGIFKTFNQFYIIDTGCYDINTVRQGLKTLVEILNGEIHIIKGEYGFLKKIAKNEITPNLFHILSAGTPVPSLKFKLEE